MTSSDQQNTETDRSAATVDGPRESIRSETVKSAGRGAETKGRLSGGRTRVHARRLVVALAGFGVLAVAGGIAYPDVRDVLFAFGAVGLLGSILVYALTLGRFVETTVVEHIYGPSAANEAALSEALNLQPWTRAKYVPVPDDDEPARLFLPARSSPEGGELVAPQDGEGAFLRATGAALFREFERTASVPPATEPSTLAVQLAEALTDQFELAQDAVTETGEGGRCATVEVVDSALGSVDRFDHPIASFLAVGFAAGLSKPVTLEVTRGDSSGDWVITCCWEPP